MTAPKASMTSGGLKKMTGGGPGLIQAPNLKNLQQYAGTKFGEMMLGGGSNLFDKTQGQKITMAGVG
jgi:hypothetical protein